MNRFSLLQDTKICYVCGSTRIHTHEVFYGNNRQKSIEDGCCVYLCPIHHNMSDLGVHFNHKLDLDIKKQMQLEWMKHYNKKTDDFIKRYGRSYI